MGLDNPLHIAFLLIVMLLVFGAKRLPEMGQSLGSGLRGFKEALNQDGPERATLAAHAAASEPAPVQETMTAHAAASEPEPVVVERERAAV